MMRHKLYIASMIVLPLFVGSGATFESISYFSGHDISMNPIVIVILAIAGMCTGVFNLWKLIEKAE